jgi:hypothetical protein
MSKIKSSFLLMKKMRAQAIVEFALVLPFLLLLIYGTIEVARLAFIFSSASNASRAAVRYGAASGENSEGTPYYEDCDGIRNIVNESAYIAKFDTINITYDRGVNPDGTQIPISGVDPSPSNNSCPVADINVRNGDRIIVQVSTSYQPILSIIPIEPLQIVSSSARTFLISIPILGSAVPTGFSAETSTPSKVPTKSFITSTPAFTAVLTATRLPTLNFTTVAGIATNIPPSTLTYTPSFTPPPTHTATITPTFISCSGFTSIGHGALVIKDNIMEMMINNNTNHVLSTLQIYVEWNHDTGHSQGSDHSLHLRQVTLDNQVWNDDVFAPSAYLQDFHPNIPMGESVIRFIFNQNYDLLDGTERIVISPGTPGCTSYSIDSSH